jgi:uncharacterized protein YjbJ (UPF0337 family)
MQARCGNHVMNCAAGGTISLSNVIARWPETRVRVTAHGNHFLSDGFGCEVAFMPWLYHKEIAMDWNRIEGSWKELKGKAKETWGRLTDDDLDKIAGKREQLEGKIQQRYGVSKDLAQKDVDDWLNKMQ